MLSTTTDPIPSLSSSTLSSASSLPTDANVSSPSSSSLPSSRSNEEQSEIFPEMVVFDLDFTLWPFWVDTHVEPPFRRIPRSKLSPKATIVDVRDNQQQRLTPSSFSSARENIHHDDTEIVDAHNRIVKVYPDVRKIFHHLEEHNVTIAIASRTTTADDAESLLSILPSHPHQSHRQTSLWDLINSSYTEMYNTSKHNHFREIMQRSGVPYENMLFFDDDETNIRIISALGVTCVYLPHEAGLSWDLYQQGLRKYRQQHTPKNNKDTTATSKPFSSSSSSALFASSSSTGPQSLPLSTVSSSPLTTIPRPVYQNISSTLTTSCTVPGQHYLFVYGSLRQGLHNHWKLSTMNPIFICNGDTDERFTMLGLRSLGFPYVTRTLYPDIHQTFIKGEVYQVNDQNIKELDAFEGVPEHYARSIVRIFPDPHGSSSSTTGNDSGTPSTVRREPYGTPLLAFIYVVEDMSMLAGLKDGLESKYERFVGIESGDWKAYVTEKTEAKKQLTAKKEATE